MKLRTVLAVLVFAGFAACTNAPTIAAPERGADFSSGTETRPAMESVATDSAATTGTERGGGALGGGS